jgi:undecaprenyl diphosphate synthase
MALHPPALSAIDSSRLPAHVGIIMDGNGRWARLRDLNRSAGHREGLVTTKKIVGAAADLGIRYLSLYTFSTENWKRAEEEVSFLMSLVRQYIRKEYDFYREHRIRIRFAGNMDGLPPEVQADIRSAMDDTKQYDRLDVVLAMNYGGRDEIVRAVRRWIADSGNEGVPDEAALSSHMDNPDIPDPDMIIRSANEYRTSNFLLWEGSYAELFFSEKLWPDFTTEDFFQTIREYQGRDRKYGGTK